MGPGMPSCGCARMAGGPRIAGRHSEASNDGEFGTMGQVFRNLAVSLVYAIFITAVAGTLVGSSCHIGAHSHGCDDDDDFFGDDDDDFGCDDDDDSFCCDDDDDHLCCFSDDDDDDFFAVASRTGGAGQPRLDPFHIGEHERIPGFEASEHPLAAVIPVNGPALFAAGLPHSAGMAELEEFTSSVLMANPELFGMPDEAGELFFATVESTPVRIVVTWEQWFGLGEDALPGGTVRFELDGLGRLLRVENTTLLQPPATNH